MQAGRDLQPAVAVSPGDVIEWRLEARNSADQPVAGVSLDLPGLLPPSTGRLSGGSLRGPDVISSRCLWRSCCSAPMAASRRVAPLVRELIETVDGEE